MRSKAKSLRIMVTDAHTLAGLGAVRSLGRAGHNVIAAYPNDVGRPAGSWSRYWSGELCYPHPSQYQFEFRDWFRDQVNRRTFDVLLPVTESSIVGVAAVRKDLPSDLLAILPSDSALEYTLSKFHSTRLALSLGIPCPATVFISDGTPTGEWNHDFSRLHFPIIIKTDNHLTPEGAYLAGRKFIASNADEAKKILRDLEHIKTRIIAQELIPGRGTGVFLLRFGGRTHLKFAHRRLHEVPYTGGHSSFREGCRDDELVRLGESILEAVGYEGVAMVEFRRGAIDGKPYFLEINGRLWGSLALALHSGIDFPKALIECYQNGCPPPRPPNYRSGVKCRNIFSGELSHLISILKARPTKGVESPPSKAGAVIKFFVLSLNPMIRHDYFWWTDPLPGILQATHTVSSYADKILKKGARKFRKHREDRMLERFQSEHQIRCSQPKYFDRSLNQVMFLCYGNICRSPFAAQLWNTRIQERSLEGPMAISAGFHPHTTRKAPSWIKDLAREYGVDLSKHRSRILTRSNTESIDAIFIMDRTNYRDLIAQFPGAKNKTHFLGLFADNGRIEVDDPYYMSTDDARTCYQQIVRSLGGLMKRTLGV